MLLCMNVFRSDSTFTLRLLGSALALCAGKVATEDGWMDKLQTAPFSFSVS